MSAFSREQPHQVPVLAQRRVPVVDFLLVPNGMLSARSDGAQSFAVHATGPSSGGQRRARAAPIGQPGRLADLGASARVGFSSAQPIRVKPRRWLHCARQNRITELPKRQAILVYRSSHQARCAAT